MSVVKFHLSTPYITKMSFFYQLSIWSPTAAKQSWQNVSLNSMIASTQLDYSYSQLLSTAVTLVAKKLEEQATFKSLELRVLKSM